MSEVVGSLQYTRLNSALYLRESDLLLEPIHLTETAESASPNNYLPIESVRNNRIALTELPKKIGDRDASYLSACHLEWRTKWNLAAYQELLAALDDHDRDIRRLAEFLLQRSSPRPDRTATRIGSR